jgi:hypothetical protein
MSNDRRDFLKTAEQLGFEFVRKTGSGHMRLYNAEIGRHYTASFSPSDWRGRRNSIADMQRIAGRKLARNGKHSH